MKTCPACGTEADDQAIVCRQCQHAFVPSHGTAEPSVTYVNRPTGRPFIVCGVIAFVVGAIAIFIWLLIPAKSYGLVDEDNLVLKGEAMMLGSALFSIGFALLSVGYILRALWFLPGEERKKG